VLAACTKSGNGSVNPVSAGDPTILRFVPGSGNVGDTVLIIGTNFRKTLNDNKISFATTATTAPIQVYTGGNYDSLVLIVPSGATSNKLTVSVGSKTVTTKDTFWVTKGQWIRRADVPAQYSYDGIGFTIGNKGYYAPAGQANWITIHETYEFDPTLNKWTKRADMPAMDMVPSTSFAIGDTGYLVFGTSAAPIVAANTVNTYSPITNSWSTANRPPGDNFFIEPLGFAAAGKGYVIALAGPGIYQFLMYDPGTGSWTIKGNNPVPPRQEGSGFVVNDEVYYGGGYWDTIPQKDFWKYSPSTDKWTQVADLPLTSYIPSVNFCLNGKGYTLFEEPTSSRGSQFYEYDPTTNKWSMEKAFPGRAYFSRTSIVAGNRAFVTGGDIFISPNHDSASKETWEFIP